MPYRIHRRANGGAAKHGSRKENTMAKKTVTLAPVKAATPPAKAFDVTDVAKIAVTGIKADGTIANAMAEREKAQVAFRDTLDTNGLTVADFAARPVGQHREAFFTAVAAAWLPKAQYKAMVAATGATKAGSAAHNARNKVNNAIARFLTGVEKVEPKAVREVKANAKGKDAKPGGRVVKTPIEVVEHHANEVNRRIRKARADKVIDTKAADTIIKAASDMLAAAKKSLA
jgi:hypothetical protein